MMPPSCPSAHSQDVVAPPFLEDIPEVERVKPEAQWEVGLLHAGGVWGWKDRGEHRLSAYSQGVRQASRAYSYYTCYTCYTYFTCFTYYTYFTYYTLAILLLCSQGVWHGR